MCGSTKINTFHANGVHSVISFLNEIYSILVKRLGMGRGGFEYEGDHDQINQSLILIRRSQVITDS